MKNILSTLSWFVLIGWICSLNINKQPTTTSPTQQQTVTIQCEDTEDLQLHLSIYDEVNHTITCIYNETNPVNPKKLLRKLK